jgi:hypothetical protein
MLLGNIFKKHFKAKFADYATLLPVFVMLPVRKMYTFVKIHIKQFFEIIHLPHDQQGLYL